MGSKQFCACLKLVPFKVTLKKSFYFDALAKLLNCYFDFLHSEKENILVRIKATRICCLDSTSHVVEMSLRTGESLMFSCVFFSGGRKKLLFSAEEQM